MTAGNHHQGIGRDRGDWCGGGVLGGDEAGRPTEQGQQGKAQQAGKIVKNERFVLHAQCSVDICVGR